MRHTRSGKPAEGSQPTLFTWLPSDAPPMAAHHDRLRALPPDAPDEDWWTRHDNGLTYCWRHCINFKAPSCWLCDASRAATVPSLGHRNDMEA